MHGLASEQALELHLHNLPANIFCLLLPSCCSVCLALAGNDADVSAGMQADYEFPKFVGHRRRLPPDDQLFHEGNVERELFAKQLAIQVRFVHLVGRLWLDAVLTSTAYKRLLIPLSCKHSHLSVQIPAFLASYSAHALPRSSVPGHLSDLKEVLVANKDPPLPQ